MGKCIIFANWKMNKTIKEAEIFVKKLVETYVGQENLELIMCVPYPYIGFLVPLCDKTCIGIGSENIFYGKWGAFTGEVSAPMLASIGCRYALIGHSERRKYFNENDRDVNRKMLSALDHGLLPLVCIGETREERDSGNMFEVLKSQVKTCLKDISKNHKFYIAYEPRWAIGTGITPEYHEIEEAHLFIREKIVALYGTDISDNICLLYGGSVFPENSYQICSLNGVDGCGYGGCSLDFACFSKAINESARALI